MVMTKFLVATLFAGALASPTRRGKGMGKKGMGMGGSPPPPAPGTQTAYLQCTPVNPQINNPTYCTAGTPSYALDSNGNQIPVNLIRGERGTRVEYLHIEQVPDDYVFSTYNVFFPGPPNGDPPLFVGNFRGATSNRNGVTFRDLSLNAGLYGDRTCAPPSANGANFPYNENTCAGMTAAPVQRYTNIPTGNRLYNLNAMNIQTRYIRFVVKNHGARTALGDPADNSFSNQDQDFELISQYRLDAPECGADTSLCPNWWIADFPSP